MKTYDPSKPLIFSHIPKTAGTSVRELFTSWYGPNLLLHYKDESRPPVHDLENPPEPGKPVVIYGHFSRNRGVGIDKYYPQVDQFITILRDPLERVLSGYFFKTQNETMRRAFWGTARLTVDQYVGGWQRRLVRGANAPITNFFPGEVNHDNFKDVINDRFVEVGVVEHLDISMTRIAEKLGFEFDVSELQHLNAAKRTHEVSDKAKENFKKSHQLEYAIYEYAKERLLRSA